MRIAKFEVTQDNYEDTGIHPISLNKTQFGHIVALIGKNGSGKSRVLDLVEKYPLNTSLKNMIEDHFIHLNDSQNKLIQQIIKPRTINGTINDKITLTQEIIDPAQLSSGNQIRLEKLRKQLSDSIKKIDINVLSDDAISTPYLLDQLLEPTNNTDINEFNSLSIESTINYISDLTLSITDEQVITMFDEDKDGKIATTQAAKNLDRLNFYLQEFLGKKISFKPRASKGSYTTTIFFNKRPFTYEKFIKELSPGQKILYKYALLFYYYEVTSSVKISHSVIIIDEPETHLHPSSQIDVIDKISGLVKDYGQLWIATHSINILAHLDYENILAIKDETLYPPSRKSHSRIYNDLMHYENHIHELQSFVYSINDFHYSNYIKECFKNPTVVSAIDKNDAQYKLLRQKLLDSNKVLDFGAGTGRIGLTMIEDGMTNIEYYAYDIDKDNISKIKEFGIAKDTYIESKTIPQDFFDLIIVSNVLHEINPLEWLPCFATIADSLKDDGYLLILEDLELVRGENAHDYGYIVLGINELAVLLNNSPVEVLKPKDSEKNNYGERLYLAAFSKKSIAPTPQSLIKSLENLEINIFNKIDDIRNRKEEVDELISRRYAHFSQLYINASLFLKDKEVYSKLGIQTPLGTEKKGA